MSEVRWRDKRSGRIVVYESTTETDPETGGTVRRRRYLGTADEETGELIPSLGRPGRRPGSRNRPKPEPDANGRADLDLGERLLAAEAERDGLRERVRALESELEARRDADERVRDMVSGLWEAVSSL